MGYIMSRGTEQQVFYLAASIEDTGAVRVWEVGLPWGQGGGRTGRS